MGLDGGFSQLTAATNNNVLILQHRAAPPPPTSVKNGDESQFRRRISPSHVPRKAKRAIAKILQREILFSQIAFCILSVVLAAVFFFFFLEKRDKQRERAAGARANTNARQSAPLSHSPLGHFSPTGTFSEHTRNYVHAGCKCRPLSSRVSQAPAPRLLPRSRVHTRARVAPTFLDITLPFVSGK